MNPRPIVVPCIAASAALILLACMSGPATPSDVGASATAMLASPSGDAMGTVMLTQTLSRPPGVCRR